MNNEFSKDISKSLNKSKNIGELAPGETGRRFEPKEGLDNLTKRIHRESDYIDKNKNMPFTFSKPRPVKRFITKVCSNCEEYVSVHKDTVGIICRHCKKYSQVKEVYIEEK